MPYRKNSALFSDQYDGSLPTVVIVGRPNVGKSSLFNRLLNRAQAITSEIPGVTRDCISARWVWKRRAVMLSDTGGQLERGAGIGALVTERAREAGHRADCIVLVVENSGITPLDREVIAHLRPRQRAVLCVVNKTDRYSGLDTPSELRQLGFENIVAVSASHGTNIAALKERIGALLSAQESEGEGVQGTVSAAGPRFSVAIIGRPNCGKSTLSNRLAGEQRSLVTDQPGTTRDVVSGVASLTLARSARSKGTPQGSGEAPQQPGAPGEEGAPHYQIVVFDTAGLRRAAKVQERIEFYSTRRAMSAIALSNMCLLMIDAQEGMTAQDKRIAEYATRLGKGLVIVVNKIDLLTEGSTRRALRAQIQRTTPHLSYAPLVVVSALTGEGVDQLTSTIALLWRQLNRRVPTAVLNRTSRALLSHLPAQRTVPTLGYMTQSGTNPVEFVLFFNRLRGLSHSVRSHIANRIRAEFDFSHIPILISIRDGRRRDGVRL